VYSRSGVLESELAVELDNPAETIDASDVGDGTVYRKFLVRSYYTSDRWFRAGPELWGYILRTKETRSPRMDRSNGAFSISGGGGAAPGLGDWDNYIQRINITIGLDGSSGSVALDKYAFADQTDYPPQDIGALTIDMHGGDSPIYNPVANRRIFSGLAIGVADSTSGASDSWTVQLFGMERKLDDVKLINAPFWDGDKVGDVADYLAWYSGMNISFEHGNRNIPLPKSWDLENPFVNFSLGTSVIEAFRQIAEWSMHYFIIQKDGVGYFYLKDGTGLPKVVTQGTSTLHTYEEKVALNRDNTPIFDSVYNTYASLGVSPGASTGQRSPNGFTLLPDVIFEKKQSTPPLPWSKVFVWTSPGLLPTKKLLEQHNINKLVGRTYMNAGSISIPGNSTVELFDRLTIDDKTWYVYEYSHDVDFQSKTWTTNLSIANIP